jgi:hypothetical protein
MSQVVSFADFQPPPRFDALAWTEARIYEMAEADSLEADWTLIDTLALSPVDADPSDPAYRSFTTENGTADLLWYRVVFADANGDVASPTTAVQNVASSVAPYATVAELARILKIRTPSAEQETAMERVLLVAAGEINSEVDLAEDEGLAGWQLSLAAEVNLERAVEHWRQQESPFGLIGLGPELPAERTARDSWERHAHKLAPLKSQWGLA